MKIFHLISLGCPKNFVDSEVMIGILEKDGWVLVDDPEDAGTLIVNTCGFIQPAVEEAIDEILELVKIKEKYPGKKIVVTGCMVQRYQKNLDKEFPEVDLFVGTEGVKDIAKFLRLQERGKPDEKILIPDRFLMDSKMPRRLATPFFRAYLKITEGCNNHCSYCMIPSIRGPLRSRSIEDLVSETLLLEKKGVQELTLIAQDITAFGTEHKGKGILLPLLESLVASSSIPWIRLLYLYPTGITDELLHFIGAKTQILPYLDIPFQHVNQTILYKMNRKYGEEDLHTLIERSRRAIPDLAIRTTFLLGFPGEKEQDILQLENFMRREKIEHVGVFAYANEEGSPSEYFSDQVSHEEKNERVNHILAVQAEISEEIQKRYLGKIEPVLVEGVSKETNLLLEGRTKYQAPGIDGCVLINEGNASPGDIVQVQISDTLTYDLVGGILE